MFVGWKEIGSWEGSVEELFLKGRSGFLEEGMSTLRPEM